MEVIRFYSQENMLEHMAKYKTDKDRGLDFMKKMCRLLVNGIHEAQDINEFLNRKFGYLDEELVTNKFERLPLKSEEDYDANCSNTYDVIIDPHGRTVTILAFKVISSDKKPFYDKHNYDKITLGNIVH